MAKASKNGNGIAPKLPTLDDLRRAYEEGLDQILLSGVTVKMHPIQPEKLLMAGKIPDILTPLVMHMLFPPAGKDDYRFPDELDEFVSAPRDDMQDKLAFIKSVDTVCEAALNDPSVVPYLSFSDRLWIFKLAFYPVEVLSTFRLKPQGDVEAGDSERDEPQPTEPNAAVGSELGQVESVHELPV